MDENTQAQLFTINALATHLEMSPRTVRNKLKGLAPAKMVRRKDGSTLRYYRLSDVVQHLSTPDSERRKRKNDVMAEQYAEYLKNQITTKLYPDMIEAALPLLTGYFLEQFGDKAQSWRALEMVSYAIVHALEEVLDDPDAEFAIPPTLFQAREVGVEKFIAKNWPD